MQRSTGLASLRAGSRRSEPHRIWSGGGPIPFHPLLFALFPPLALYARNVAEANLGDLGRPVALSALGALGAWAVAAAALRNGRKAALVASALVVLFFSYGHAWNLLPAVLRGALAPAWLLLGGVSAALVARGRSNFFPATVALNLASFALLFPSAWAIGASLAARPHAPQASASEPPAADMVRPRPRPTRTDLPDIYYIVLDAYGRGDTLREFYGFDNTPFLNALRQRGFYIASQSHANYDQTGLCVASALNMRYLDGLGKTISAGEGAEETLRRMIDRNEVARRLREQGYEYDFIGTGSGQTRVETADVSLGAAAGETRRSSLEQQMFAMTALETPGEKRHRDYARHRGYLMSAFDSLESVGARPGPKFVFAHIMAPHPPFVLGPNGQAIDPSYMFSYADASWLRGMISASDYRAGYTGQLQYVNRRVLSAIDAIRQTSARPPIIILQGDHGSRMNLDWDSLERTNLQEPFSIFNAYSVPASVRPALYDTITPVDSFRILLSRLFGQDLPPLSDRSAYSTAARPLDLTDVTARLATSSRAASRAAQIQSGVKLNSSQ